MFELLLVLTGFAIGGGALLALARSRDPLHPGVILAPVLGYVYCVWPLVLDREGGIQRLLESDRVAYVAALYLVSLVAFYAGMLRSTGPLRLAELRPGRVEGGRTLAGRMDPETRRKCYLLALLLGALSVAAFIVMIQNVGGFEVAFSKAKGGGRSPSGYIGEAVLLSFPAVILLALARQGTGRVRLKDLLVALVVASPHLVQGTLGGRRGPLFLSLSVLLFGWMIIRGRRPTAFSIFLGIGLIGACVVFVQSQRHYVFMGSGDSFEANRMLNTVGGLDRLESNDYVAGATTVLAADYYEDYYWGYRYLVTIFVRPIPKQLWPTKYEDMDARWLNRWSADEGGADLLEVVGFSPPVGSSVGFIADIYYEFSWGVLLVVYLFGWFLSNLWRRHRLKGGLWTILFVEAMILGVYIPTQTFSAWFHRFLFMAVASLLVWRFWFSRSGHPLMVVPADPPRGPHGGVPVRR